MDTGVEHGVVHVRGNEHPRAVKKKKPTTWVNDGDKLKEIPVDVDVDPDEETHGLIPSANCGCGFWVYKSAERARAQFAAELKRPRGAYGDFDGRDELVMAAVAGWGRAVEGTDGWRFEKARIVGLVTDEPHRFRRVLDRYRIPALQTVGLGPWLDFEAKPLADTLDALESYVRKYVVLTEEQRTAAVLWAAHTWVIDACEVSPYLSVTSAVMRSGKSQLVGTLRHVVADPWVAIQPSEAVLFRRIHEARPTLFLDEVDTLFHSKDDRHEPLRALLNAGNRRGTTVPRVTKTAKGEFGIVDFEVFCAKLLAGIGHPPVTVADRADRDPDAEEAPAGHAGEVPGVLRQGRRARASTAAGAVGVLRGDRAAAERVAGPPRRAERPPPGFLGAAPRDRRRGGRRLGGARAASGRRAGQGGRGRGPARGRVAGRHPGRVRRPQADQDRGTPQGARREGPVGRLVGRRGRGREAQEPGRPAQPDAGRVRHQAEAAQDRRGEGRAGTSAPTSPRPGSGTSRPFRQETVRTVATVHRRSRTVPLTSNVPFVPFVPRFSGRPRRPAPSAVRGHIRAGTSRAAHRGQHESARYRTSRAALSDTQVYRSPSQVHST